MGRESTYSGILGEMSGLINSLDTNLEEVPHLAGVRERISLILGQAQETANLQALQKAQKQETSKQLRTLVLEGQRLTNATRSILKQHYGLRSERLAEFGIQPFRGRTRKPKTAPDLPSTPIPP
jgi:hypothetical protein